MQYRVNPKNGERLSALGFGCMRFTRGGGGIDRTRPTGSWPWRWRRA